jgi:hypothetical protein
MAHYQRSCVNQYNYYEQSILFDSHYCDLLSSILDPLFAKKEMKQLFSMRHLLLSIH